MSEKENTTKAPATTTNINKKSKGSDWNVNRCKKFAKRFNSESDWGSGHPSSFKAASSNGWLKECKNSFGENEKNAGSAINAA